MPGNSPANPRTSRGPGLMRKPRASRRSLGPLLSTTGIGLRTRRSGVWKEISVGADPVRDADEPGQSHSHGIIDPIGQVVAGHDEHVGQLIYQGAPVMVPPLIAYGGGADAPESRCWWGRRRDARR